MCDVRHYISLFENYVISNLYAILILKLLNQTFFHFYKFRNIGNLMCKSLKKSDL